MMYGEEKKLLGILILNFRLTKIFFEIDERKCLKYLFNLLAERPLELITLKFIDKK